MPLAPAGSTKQGGFAHVGYLHQNQFDDLMQQECSNIGAVHGFQHLGAVLTGLRPAVEPPRRFSVGRGRIIGFPPSIRHGNAGSMHPDAKFGR